MNVINCMPASICQSVTLHLQVARQSEWSLVKDQ